MAKEGKDLLFLPGSPVTQLTALGQATEGAGRSPSWEVFKAWLSKATASHSDLVLGTVPLSAGGWIRDQPLPSLTP